MGYSEGKIEKGGKPAKENGGSREQRSYADLGSWGCTLCEVVLDT